MNAPFQSLFPEPLSIQSHSVQFLRALWEKTQAGGAHSFETAMMESTFPEQKVNASFLKRVIFSQDSRRVCFFLVVQCFLFFPFLSFVIIRRLTCHAIAGSGPSDICGMRFSQGHACLLRWPTFCLYSVSVSNKSTFYLKKKNPPKTRIITYYFSCDLCCC